MPRRIDPMREARIYQARLKKAAQIRGAAKTGYVNGVKAGANAARELLAEGFNEIYDFESLVLHKLEIIEADHRILRGSDLDKGHRELFDEAKANLPTEQITEDQFIAAAVLFARSEDEAWVLHRELTEIYRDDLPKERRARLGSAIAQKFPA